MNRFLVLSVAILLTALAPLDAGSVTAIAVNGQLSGGNHVTAVCSVGKTGQITGTGVLSGTNTQNGYKYSYPFTINKGTTAKGGLVLTGNMASAGGPAVTLTSAVPGGPVTFTYVVNGKPYSFTGTGTVSVK